MSHANRAGVWNFFPFVMILQNFWEIFGRFRDQGM